METRIRMNGTDVTFDSVENYLESLATIVRTSYGDDYYYLPYWFKKLGYKHYELIKFDNLPESLTQSIKAKREEPPKEEPITDENFKETWEDSINKAEPKKDRYAVLIGYSYSLSLGLSNVIMTLTSANGIDMDDACNVAITELKTQIKYDITIVSTSAIKL